MLKRIKIENYKAFNKEAIIDIWNINILLWKNSVWKSSILEIFMLIMQTINEDNINSLGKSNLLLNWKLLKLWKNNDFIYSSWEKNEKWFKITIDFISDIFNDFLDNYNINLTHRLRRFSEEKVNIKTTDFKNKQYINNLIKKINSSKKKYWWYEKNTDIIDLLNLGLYFNNILKSKTLSLCINFIKSNENIVIDKYSIYIWKKLFVNIKKEWLNYITAWYKKDIWSIWILFNSILPKVKSNDDKKDKYLYFSFDKEWVLNRFLHEFNNEFKRKFSNKNIFHITPLRANPKRHYLVDEFYNFSSDLWESLVQELEKKDVIDFVNKWFKEFWLKIVTDWKNNSVLKSLKVQQYWWNRDIVDVWFWISQILPIIVQSMIAPKWSIVLIEQPEIHLHPSMQSKLADLFIDIVKERNLKLIIETHSEYFLNRLKLRLAQTNNNNDLNDYKIRSDQINIYFFSENKAWNWTKVDKVKIHKFWKIDFPKWFKDYDDNFAYMQEILKLNLD